MLADFRNLMFAARLSQVGGWRVIADQSALTLSVYPLRL